LTVALAALITLFSTLLYSYIKVTTYDSIKEELVKQAIFISNATNATAADNALNFFSTNKQFGSSHVAIVLRPDLDEDIVTEYLKENGKEYLRIYYPFYKQRLSFISVTKDVTDNNRRLAKILRNIIIINIATSILILIFANILSQILINPIRILTTKISQMNENRLTSVNISTLPLEFLDLGVSFNRLIDRIETFVKYQKELFIGAAHELKTPLAVMKVKNEVTMLKPRDADRYIEALKLNNKTIDEMNAMVTNILEIGRQEGAQFEKPIEIDVIAFLQEKTSNFKLLLEERKTIETDISPKTYTILTQPTLLTHIIQNFAQNAIKFSPAGGIITIACFPIYEGLRIEVRDQGEGIDESKDLFAPFKRYGNKAGAGLGLFLAKGAADALGATIDIKNAKNNNGTVASLEIYQNATCDLNL
jgi:two-component system OmpR family sensor kinase